MWFARVVGGAEGGVGRGPRGVCCGVTRHRVGHTVADRNRFKLIYDEGLVRFAVNDFTLDSELIKDNRIHVTNFDVNKE